MADRRRRVAAVRRDHQANAEGEVNTVHADALPAALRKQESNPLVAPRSREMPAACRQVPPPRRESTEQRLPPPVSAGSHLLTSGGSPTRLRRQGSAYQSQASNAGAACRGRLEQNPCNSTLDVLIPDRASVATWRPFESIRNCGERIVLAIASIPLRLARSNLLIPND
jgi:hypothetical protein